MAVPGPGHPHLGGLQPPMAQFSGGGAGGGGAGRSKNMIFSAENFRFQFAGNGFLVVLFGSNGPLDASRTIFRASVVVLGPPGVLPYPPVRAIWSHLA
jgi:hypothetical protein